MSGYFQPVQIRVPSGTRVALAVDGHLTVPQEGNTLAGMLVGPVYRLAVTDIPNAPQAEVFPTIEIVDRTYPPPGQELRFPIPIELTADELRLAAEGALVTRVIYIEDPQQALPVAQDTEHTPWMEASQGEDPLVTAYQMGRPVAILRIGSRRPPEMGDDGSFTYGCPPVQQYVAPAEYIP